MQKKSFQEYEFMDFIEDQDFCQWVLNRRPDLDPYYHDLLQKYPEKREAFEDAQVTIGSLTERQVHADPVRKTFLWHTIRENYRSRKIRPMTTIARYAAAILLPVLSIILVAIFHDKNPDKDDLSQYITHYNRQDYNQTKLILDDGQEINIPEEQSEIILDSSSFTIMINDREIHHSKQKKEAPVNQLMVPFGKRSKIVLSDNTVVWLNSGSSLIYPTTFRGKQRVVRLVGEAFLEVSKDPERPFIVETNLSKIQVLGTRFNIKAYPDETTEETVLAEGSVRLSFHDTPLKQGVVLEPEQRLVFKKESQSYSVSKVNVADFICWTEGMFIFHDEPLPSVLMSISRYYNREIKWTDDTSEKIISGKLDLKSDCQKVLDNLAIISHGKHIQIDDIIYFQLQ